MHALITDIERRVRALDPAPPAAFYADVTALAGTVGRLRRIARVASEAAAKVPAEPAPALETGSAVGERAESAVMGDEGGFAAQVEPYHRELGVHCYRMVGSYDDSEDLVRETFVRAWSTRDGFAGWTTLRAWLYRIATEVCLDFLRRTDRHLPAASDDSEFTVPPWLQPYPDALLEEGGADVFGRDTIDLAFLVALQHLPPEQRAALILRDVLAFSAAHTAESLGTTVASVREVVRQARTTLREHLTRARWPSAEARAEAEQATVDGYLAAVTEADIEAMATLLHPRVLATTPPAPTRFTGRDTVLADVFGPMFDQNSPGHLGTRRYLPTLANRQPAVAAYVRRPGTTVYRAQALDVLSVGENGLIAAITSFEPHLFPAFGLPLTL